MGEPEEPLEGVDPLADAETPAQPDGAEVGFVDPWVGQYLADYYIMRRVGEGGMGIVYLARHQSLDRLAAVKFLAAHMVDDKAYIERFLNEARGAAKLNHPNIVSVYDAGCMGENIYYFIMEYIEGQNLGTMIRERRVLPVPEAVGYIRQAASALGYAHKKRIIHRDIKPDNLMLTNEGAIKVGDLGLAKWISDDSAGGMTLSGVVMGTPYYISPEQVRGSRDVDSRSDVYSLGATFYHLITGRIPYEGSSPAVIMAMHLNNPVPNPSQVNPNLDTEICAIIMKMMAKNPEDRFQSMEEADNALSDYQMGRMRSAQFNPTFAAAISPMQALPPTEPPRSPDYPPARTFGTPVTVQATDPGTSLKTAAIIGGSIIAAGLIIGAFIFIANMRDTKSAPEAVAASVPVAKPEPALAKAEPPKAGFLPAPAPAEIKLPTEVPPAPPPKSVMAKVAPSDSKLLADFNDPGDDALNRDFGMWTFSGGHGDAQVEPTGGSGGSGALRMRYDVSAPSSQWGVWSHVNGVNSSQFQIFHFRVKADQAEPVNVGVKLKWVDSKGEQFAAAMVKDVGKDWKSVVIPLPSMGVPADVAVTGVDFAFRNDSAGSQKGNVLIDDLLFLKKGSQPPEGFSMDSAKVVYEGRTLAMAARPTQPAAHSTQQGQPQKPSHEYARLETPGMPEMFGGDDRKAQEGSPGRMQVMVMTPDGVLRQPPPGMENQMRTAGGPGKSYFYQQFGEGKSTSLPGNVQALLLDSGNKSKIIQVPATGFYDRNFRCDAKWQLVADEINPEKKNVKLSHQTGAPQWVLALKTDVGSSARNLSAFILTLVVRGDPEARMVVATQPEIFRNLPTVPIGDGWRMIMIPIRPPQKMELQNVTIGVQGNGTLIVSEIRIDPPPAEILREMMRDRMDRNRQGKQPTGGFGGSSFGGSGTRRR